eukprot:12407018-Karenia_brevis.AAC.1
MAQQLESLQNLHSGSHAPEIVHALSSTPEVKHLTQAYEQLQSLHVNEAAIEFAFHKNWESCAVSSIRAQE